MPALLVPVIASALSATALSSTAIFAVSQIAAYAIVAGATYGLQQVLSPGQQAQKVASQQYQSRQAMPSLIYGYGTTKLGGAKFVFEAPNGNYIDGIIHCAGPISRFEAWALNDQGSGIAADTAYGANAFGGPNTVAPWGTNVVIESRKGVTGQSPNGVLTRLLGSKWTDQHRLDGLCNSVLWAKPVKEKNFQKTYPNGPPALYIIANLAPVYDPRDSAQVWDNPDTWKFSVNCALAILHYLTAIRGVDSVTGQKIAYGFGFPHDRIDLNSFINFANLCDQIVPKKDGTSELRYSLGGTFDMGTEERKTVLQRLLASCDGEIHQTPDGKIAVGGGQWTEPTVTISHENILGYEFANGNGSLSAFNRIKINFSDPFNDFQVIEGDPWDDLAAQVAAGQTLTEDLTLPMVQGHGQARRLAKIAMAKGNPKDKLTIVTNLVGLLCMGERIIHVVLPELEIDGTFIITSFVEMPDGTCKIGISSFGPEAYAWNPATEEGVPPAVASGLNQPVVVPDVVNPTVAVERYVVSGVVSGLGIRLTVDAPEFTDFQLKGRIRPVGSDDGAWLDMVADGPEWSVIYQPVNDGVNYEVQPAFSAPFNGTQGPWGDSIEITAIADNSSTGKPTNFVVNGSSGSAGYTFMTPDVTNYGMSKVFRSNTTNFANAVLVRSFTGAGGQPFEGTDSPLSPGSYTYWVWSYNRSGYADAASRTDPFTVTVT